MRECVRHHIPIIKKPFQDLAVISAATIKGFTDLPLLPLEIERLIAEATEIAIFKDEIEIQCKVQDKYKPLYQKCGLQIILHGLFIKLLEKYDLYEKLEYNSESMNCAASNGHLDIINWLYQNGYNGSEHVFLMAARHGQFKVLEWLYDRGCPWSVYTIKVVGEQHWL